MLVLCTRDANWMRECEAALLSGNIPSRWNRADEPGVVVLDVPASSAEHAGDALSHLFADQLSRPQVERTPTGPLMLQPAFALSVCLSALLLAFYWVTGPASSGTPWFRDGALVAERAMEGQWWRVITAATLHADAAHAVGNAGFIAILGWAVVERLGGGVMLLLAIVTAVGGFGVSLLLSDAHTTIGASGGLFGLLGAAAGHGLKAAPWLHNPRREPPGRLRRRRQIRVLGAALMLLALTAFNRQSNIHAHLGGFVSGLAAGLALTSRMLPAPMQALAGVVATAGVYGAWILALP